MPTESLSSDAVVAFFESIKTTPDSGVLQMGEGLENDLEAKERTGVLDRTASRVANVLDFLERNGDLRDNWTRVLIGKQEERSRTRGLAPSRAPFRLVSVQTGSFQFTLATNTYGNGKTGFMADMSFGQAGRFFSHYLLSDELGPRGGYEFTRTSQAPVRMAHRHFVQSFSSVTARRVMPFASLQRVLAASLDAVGRSAKPREPLFGHSVYTAPHGNTWSGVVNLHDPKWCNMYARQDFQRPGTHALRAREVEVGYTIGEGDSVRSFVHIRSLEPNDFPRLDLTFRNRFFRA